MTGARKKPAYCKTIVFTLSPSVGLCWGCYTHTQTHSRHECALTQYKRMHPCSLQALIKINDSTNLHLLDTDVSINNSRLWAQR